MTRYVVRHETSYEYGDPVVTSHNEAHLRPRQLHRQAVAKTLLSVDPSPDTLVWRKDYFGNDVVFFNLNQSHDRLRLVSTSEVDVAEARDFDPAATPPGKRSPRRCDWIVRLRTWMHSSSCSIPPRFGAVTCSHGMRRPVSFQDAPFSRRSWR